MEQVISNLSQISDPFKGLLLDAYGVFWGGNEWGALPQAVESMEKLVSQGKIVGILSNSTQLAVKEINKLDKHGIIQNKHFHFYLTSGEIARHLFLQKELPFATPKNKFWLFGEAHPKFTSHEAIFHETVYQETAFIEEADFIYISIPHINGEDQIEVDPFRPQLQKIQKYNLPMVCPNPDSFAHEGKPPRAVVRQGTIATLYEEMGGHVFYIGKPDKKAYSMAFEKFLSFNISDCKDILMIGDTPETDIRGAQQFGISSALVTETGIMADRIRHQGLKNALETLSDRPDYLIGRL